MKKIFTLLIIITISFILTRCCSTENKTVNQQTASTYLSDTVVYNKYLQQGSEYAMQTGTVLIKNVSNAIASKGSEYAIGFCNSNAIHLTDSMANAQHTTIKRVTDKPRNPYNKANEDELKYIQQLKNLVASGEKPKPRLQETNEKIVGYYPIITTDMCMQCHGDKSAIETKTLAKLTQLYPADSATGYKPNQLRGLWVVEMMKN